MTAANSENKPSPVRLEQVLESIPVGLLVLDRLRLISDLNHQAASLLGASRDELLGRPINEVLPTGYRDIIAAISSSQRTSGLKIPELYGCLIHIDRVSGEGGGAVLTIFDRRLWGPLLDDKKTPDPLEPYLHDIVVSSADGISVVDSRGYVLVANQASAVNFGVPRSHIMGQHVDKLVEKGLQDGYVADDVIKKKRKVTKVINALKTQKRILTTGTPIFGAAGQVRLVVINERDITDLVETQKILDQERQLNEKYQEELNELSLAELRSNKIVAGSPEMLNFLRTASKLSRLGVARLLITGESGTGKGLMAKYIHSCSPRAREPFIALNCAALPDHLLEAELFGYEKGAFTGANPKGKPGLFELADEGTIFLDEVGEMALPVQAKLLTFLDDQTFMRLGGTRQKKSSCAVVAATNQDLQALVDRKLFRQDLYYRLGHFKLHIPPLRERPTDITLLANSQLEELNQEYGCRRRLSPKALQMLCRHQFPGNVRELLSLMRQAVILSEEDDLAPFLAAYLPPKEEDAKAFNSAPAFSPPQTAAAPPIQTSPPPRRLDDEALKRALAESRNTREMAAKLGISQASVSRKLRQLGLTPPGRKQN